MRTSSAAEGFLAVRFIAVASIVGGTGVCEKNVPSKSFEKIEILKNFENFQSFEFSDFSEFCKNLAFLIVLDHVEP